MKKFFVATLMLSAVSAFAGDVTVLTRNIPATQGNTTVDTRFHIDTEMKEAYAKIEVDEQVTVYVQDCSYGGYYGPGYPGRGYPYPYPGNYCRTVPQIRYNTIMSDKVKIEGMTMNGDDVIYQGTDGDVVCGKMGRSRIFHVPTFYLSGKCELNGTFSYENGVKKLTVSLKTK